MVKSNHIDLAQISLPGGINGKNYEWITRTRKMEENLNKLNLEKNKEIFKELEEKYIDRLNLIGYQQEMIEKQNTILNSHNSNINNKKKKLEEYNDKIMTKKRSNIHDMEYVKIKSIINRILKIIFLILSIILIIVIVIKFKKKK